MEFYLLDKDDEWYEQSNTKLIINYLFKDIDILNKQYYKSQTLTLRTLMDLDNVTPEFLSTKNMVKRFTKHKRLSGNKSIITRQHIIEVSKSIAGLEDYIEKIDKAIHM